VQALDVLNRMARHYAGLQAYADVGEVTVTQRRRSFVTQVRFSTFYQKPAFFRFDFTVPDSYSPFSQAPTQHAVGFDGTKAYRVKMGYNGSVKKEVVDGIGLAVAGAAANSNGAANTIGRLLLADFEGFSILEPTGAKFIGDTVVDGVECYSIAAEHPTRGGKDEIWIEKDSLLLRKLLSETETTRSVESRSNIRINEPLETALFAAALRNLTSY
jgi:hypothetical protein